MLFGVFSLALNASALKVLFLGPFMGKSHSLYCQSFVLDLLKRGHAVTFLTSHSLAHLNLANYTEILAYPPLDLDELGEIFNKFSKIASAKCDISSKSNLIDFHLQLHRMN